MKRILSTLALSAVVLLSGCSSISSGHITGKTVHPPRTDSTLICAAYGSNGVCTVWVSRSRDIPERYSFSLDNGDEQGRVYVSYTTFESYEVGDWFDSGSN